MKRLFACRDLIPGSSVLMYSKMPEGKTLGMWPTSGSVGFLRYATWRRLGGFAMKPGAGPCEVDEFVFDIDEVRPGPDRRGRR